ncbi:conserved hypothetical protein [Dehalogenimonas lykanthroporepellens BL-DC-9]|jgi:hypothetical protein|nr:conserved hypothetical protein [Dehalogenimonas lykanthroporepellens BL-DC-9]
MGEIRSAKEIALEKIGEIDEITPQDRLRWKLVPEGERLAQQFLTQDFDLESVLENRSDQELEYLKKGAIPILISAIGLPKTEDSALKNNKVLGALMLLKEDKESVADLMGQLQQLFDHYTQIGEPQKQQAYQSFKSKFEQRIRQTMREQQGVDYAGQINVEQYPQFQEEWRRNLIQFDHQYLSSIDRIKQELAALA